MDSFNYQIKPYIREAIINNELIRKINSDSFTVNEIELAKSSTDLIIKDAIKKIDELIKTNEKEIEKLKIFRNSFTKKVQSKVDSDGNIAVNEIFLIKLSFLEEVLSYAEVEAEINKKNIENEGLLHLKDRISNLKNTNNLHELNVLTSLIKIRHTAVKLRGSQKLFNISIGTGFFLGNFFVSTARIFMVLSTIEIFDTVTQGALLSREEKLYYKSETLEEALKKAKLNHFIPNNAMPSWLGFAAFVPTSQLTSFSINALASNVVKNISFNYRIKNLGRYTTSGISMAVAMKVIDIVQTKFLYSFELNSKDPEIKAKAKAVLDAKKAISTGNSAMFFNSALSFMTSEFLVNIFWKAPPGINLIDYFTKLRKNLKNYKECTINYQTLLDMLSLKRFNLTTQALNFGKFGLRELLVFYGAKLLDSHFISSWLFENTIEQEAKNLSCLQNNLLTTIRAGIIRDLILLKNYNKINDADIVAVFDYYAGSKMLTNTLTIDKIYKIWDLKKKHFYTCYEKIPNNVALPSIVYEKLLDEKKASLFDNCNTSYIETKETSPYKEAVACFEELLSQDIKSKDFLITDGIKKNDPTLVRSGLDQKEERKKQIEIEKEQTTLMMERLNKEIQDATVIKIIEKLENKKDTLNQIAFSFQTQEALLFLLATKEEVNKFPYSEQRKTDFDSIKEAKFYDLINKIILLKIEAKDTYFSSLYNMLYEFSKKMIIIDQESLELKPNYEPGSFTSLVDSLCKINHGAVIGPFRIKAVLSLAKSLTPVTFNSEAENKEYIELAKKYYNKALNDSAMNPEHKQLIMDYFWLMQDELNK